MMHNGAYSSVSRSITDQVCCKLCREKNGMKSGKNQLDLLSLIYPM